MSTEIPNEIPFSSIINVEKRVRKTYNGIDELADHIVMIGLIHPLILRPVEDGWELVDGGRRWTALKQLETKTLYHATSTTVGRPGFIIKGEDNSSDLMNLLAEISANHDREDIKWQEELPAIVRAWRMIEREHHLRGESIVMRQFGGMLGVSYQNLQAAVTIYDAFMANPERFADCSTVRVALAKLYRDAADETSKLLVGKCASESVAAAPSVVVQTGPQPEVEYPQHSVAEVPTPNSFTDERQTISIPLSQMFYNVDSLAYMAELPKGRFNHIFCDPDYALSEELLSAGSNTDSHNRGIAQDSPFQSLFQLQQFIKLAYNVVDDYGFCVFWMDLNYWNFLRGGIEFVEISHGPDWGFNEKLELVQGFYRGTPGFCEAVGWLVQPWPGIWRKAKFNSNKAPRQRFTKNIEYAMILRKPKALLEEVQNSSVFEYECLSAVKEFNHPYAKPRPVWRWFFQAICQKGQSVYDPFMGAGSSCVAAVEHGLAPHGTEINPEHFSNAIVNVRLAYEAKLQPKKVLFV